MANKIIFKDSVWTQTLEPELGDVKVLDVRGDIVRVEYKNHPGEKRTIHKDNLQTKVREAQWVINSDYSPEQRQDSVFQMFGRMSTQVGDFPYPPTKKGGRRHKKTRRVRKTKKSKKTRGARRS